MKILLVFLLFFAKTIYAGSSSFQDGLNYYNSQEYTKAYNIFLNLSKNGYEEAQYNLGLLYMDGLGVEKNCHKAIHWFKKASLKDDVDATFNIAALYDAGECIEEDNDEALFWYEKAINLDDEEAIYFAGVIYSEKKDYKKSYDYFLKSSLLRNEFSMYELAYQYFYGQGIKRDYFKSYLWVKLSILNGNDTEFTNNNLNVVRNRLSFGKTQEANLKANSCYKNSLISCI
jgi:TPR repeat protein